MLGELAIVTAPAEVRLPLIRNAPSSPRVPPFDSVAPDVTLLSPSSDQEAAGSTIIWPS